MSVLLRSAWLGGGRPAAYGHCEHLRVRQGHHAVAGVEPLIGNAYLGHGALELAAECPRAEQLAGGYMVISGTLRLLS
jgi:hypothetical protein